MKRLKVGALTDPGLSRDHNQDALGSADGYDPVLLERKGFLCLVADGLGPEGTGAVASSLAVRTVLYEYYNDPSPDIVTSLTNAIEKANQAIIEEKARNSSYARMGTTLVAGIVRGDDLYVANVGDSRAYLVRGQRIIQLTHDHTWVADQVRAGQLSPEEAQTHPKRRHLSRSLGLQPAPPVDHFHQQFLPGDRLLLCSDGLSDLVADQELLDVATRHAPQAAAQELTGLANQRGGTDNITVLVAEPQKAFAFGALPIVPAAAGAAILLLVLLLALLARAPDSYPETAGTSTLPVTAASGGVSLVSVTPSDTPWPQETVTVVPTTVEAPTVTPGGEGPTPRPSRTPQPHIAYGAPVLTGPEDGATFTGPDAVIVLSWEAVGDLAQDEYYVVTIPYPHEGATWHEIAWTKGLSFQLPEYLYELISEPRECQWNVAVMRQTGIGDEGEKTGVALGEPSVTRTLVWHSEQGGRQPGPGQPSVPPTPTFQKP
jgi:serine/threonine protein phosphatase PrpC